MGTMNDLADLVRRERLNRGWSVRDAARHGGISNTYWGGFEDYKQPLTPLIAKAVARAYDWKSDWAAVSPSDEVLSPSQLARVEAVSETMQALDRRVENLEKALAAVEARLDSTDGRSLSGGT